jgi:leader peptidase (prepilin peptidase)/N-methyltransferase
MLFLLFFIPLGLVISIVDVKLLRIPDVLVLILFAGFVIISFITEGIGHFPVRMLCGTGVFSFLYLTKKLMKGKMGFGDVKYAAVLAFALKLTGSWVMLFSACLMGILFYVIFLKNKQKNNNFFAFGPFLSIGALFAFICVILYQGI